MYATKINHEGTIPDVIDGWDYRCQWDPRFAGIPYSVTRNPDQTLAHGGCVPVLQTVALRNLCQLDTEPGDLADWNVSNGMRTPDSGTKRISWNLLADQTGMRQELTPPEGAAMTAALAAGGLLVVSLKTPDRTGLGTPSGHVVGIREITAGMTKVIDVNDPESTAKTWNLDAHVLPFIASRVRHLRPPLPGTAGVPGRATLRERWHAARRLRG